MTARWGVGGGLLLLWALSAPVAGAPTQHEALCKADTKGKDDEQLTDMLVACQRAYAPALERDRAAAVDILVHQGGIFFTLGNYALALDGNNVARSHRHYVLAGLKSLALANLGRMPDAFAALDEARGRPDCGRECIEYLKGMRQHHQGKRGGRASWAAPSGSAEALVQSAEAALKHGDSRRHVALLEQAAAKGSVGAMVDLGLYFMSGLYVEKDERRGAAYYAAAADQGSPVALSRLAVAYLEGAGVPKDTRKALEAIARLERVDRTEALFAYGRYYMTVGDKDVAFASFQKAADAGHAGAWEVIAPMLEKGEGTARDSAKAIAAYKKTIPPEAPFHPFIAGNAALQIGRIYETGGSNVPKDRNAAISWYRRAVDFGNDEAKEALARLGAK
jgi:TPR repeat protein